MLHVLSSYEVGGGEVVALRLARWQSQMGWNVHVVGLSADGPLRSSFEAAGIQAHVVAKGPGFDKTLFYRLGQLVARLRAQIVHPHNPMALIYATPGARILGRKVVYTKHGEPGSADDGLSFWLRRAASTFANALVSVSEETHQRARRDLEAPPWTLHVIENGVDVERFSRNEADRREVRRELGADDDTFVIGAVGRQQPLKNHVMLVEAAASLLDAKHLLVLVGDGPEHANIGEKVRMLEVESYVRLLGFRPDVGRLLSAFDCFAMSSRTEGMPLVLLEAMSCELPVVSTAVGGIPALVPDPLCGLLVPEGDSRSLGRALHVLATDRQRARQMGRQGRRRVVERHSVEKMAESYAELYRHL